MTIDIQHILICKTLALIGANNKLIRAVDLLASQVKLIEVIKFEKDTQHYLTEDRK